jgi:hypothetical protein
MKSITSLFYLSCLIVWLSGCTAPSTLTPESQAQFTKVQALLETNCVHCHGDNHLSTMPPFGDSRALTKLIGSKTWIIPGQPASSRLYQVVTFSDNIPGAMPPTGHGISTTDVRMLHDWIKAGAQVPAGKNIRFTPRGKSPRSI